MPKPVEACAKDGPRSCRLGCLLAFLVGFIHDEKKPSPRRPVLPFRPPRDGTGERYDLRRDQMSDLVPRGAVTRQSEPEPSYH
jgi:hypothetical protein